MPGAKTFFNVSAPGGETFQANYFRGVERISDLFCYEILMTAESRTVDFSSMIGKSATVTVAVGNEKRYFNGIIGHFQQLNTPLKPLDAWTTYQAFLYPNLWLLTFAGQCRIFQNKSTIDIIKSVLSESQIQFTNNVGSAGSQTREFCVQYNETNFAFISRLMEQVGIFYYFSQSENGHKLVLGDSPDAFTACSSVSKANFAQGGVEEQNMNTVSSCFVSQCIVPKSSTIKSYNYLTPTTKLSALSQGPSSAGGGDITAYNQVYLQQSLGNSLAKTRIESEDAPQKMVEGVSTVPFFLAGNKFTLDGHPRSDANASYALYEVIHEVRIVPKGPQKPLYNNTYKAFSSSLAFKPPQVTPWPRIYGTQTAFVTGKSGEEIYTEEYGRIKIKFHWDPSKADNETTSCWVRVATLWSGKGWGSLFTPRIGHEVVVSFIDGNPDNPLVVGSVYNAQNKPPYLPSDPTKSTIKSQSSKAGSSGTPGFNEFRFEDKKGSEEVYLHAQKDYTKIVQNNETVTIVGGNRAVVLQSKSEKQEQRSGNQSNDSLKLANGNKSLTITKGNYTVQLNQGNISITCSKGDVTFDVTGNISFKCTENFSINAKKNVSITAGQGITAKATEAISEQAGTSYTLKSGEAMSLTSGAALTAKASDAVSIEAGADLTAKAGGAANIETSAEAAVKAGGALNLTGGGTLSAKGATVEVEGATISLNG